MRQAPYWFRQLLYDLHLRRLERFCGPFHRHICIYPPGHLTKREAEELFRRVREWEARKRLDTE